jgi:hypothetical protein
MKNWLPFVFFPAFAILQKKQKTHLNFFVRTIRGCQKHQHFHEKLEIFWTSIHQGGRVC